MAAPTARTAVALLFLTALSVAPRAQAPVDSSQYVVMGDMLLDRARVSSDPLGRRGMLAFLEGTNWPAGVVPVAFVATITPAQRAQFFTACGEWTRVANVRCVGRTSEASYVNVSDQTSGCSAVVGYGVGPRAMWLGPGCWGERTLQHEIGHALGLMHEHQRSDRDQYVTVDYSNVEPGFESAFAIVANSQNVGPYDFSSIMHYTWLSFARDGSRPVLIPKPGYEQFRVAMGDGQPEQPPLVYTGGGTRPSAGDRAGIRARYGASPTFVGEPLNLRLTAAAGNTVTVAWTPPAGPPVRGYTLRAYAPPTGPVMNLGARIRVPLPPSFTSVTGAVPNGAYLLEVTATGDAGESAPSNTLGFLAPGGTPFVPPIPPRLTSSVAGGNVTLSWSDGNSTPAATYIIEAGPPDGPMQRYNVGSLRTLTAPLPLGVPLRIAVEAHAPYSYQRSNPVRAQWGGLTAPVFAPPTVANRTVSMSWSAVAGATGYLVRARLRLSDPPVAELPVAGTSVSIPGVPPGSYNLYVVAVGGGFRSDESNGWQIQVP